MKAICNLDVHVDFKDPKYSSPIEEETKSSSAMDTSPSHRSRLTPVVGEMHNEARQAAGGLTSLGDTSEDGAHPQLSSGSNPSVLVDKTKSARDGLKTAHTTSSANEESGADDISRKVKLEDLTDVLKDTRSAFFTPNSPIDETIIVSDVSEEEENAKNDKDTEDTSVPPLSPKSAQLQELIAQVAELKNIQWKLPIDILDLPHLESLVQEKLKTLDSLLGEKDANTNLKNELVDLLGIDIVTPYYNKKLLYERYYEKMKKTRQSSKIINCDVLTKKGPISLKSQEKGMIIRKLKDRIKHLSGKYSLENVKKDIDEIETINIELEHTLKNSKPNATIASRMFKLDIEPISYRLKNNRDDRENGSLKTKDSNKPLLTSTRVKHNISASGSKPSGNTKENRIMRPPSSNQKNKVEDHFRKVKSSLNTTNSVSEPVSRTFTIVRNRYPLTRITSTKVVPTKERSTKSIATPTQGILVYSRRAKATRSLGSSSKVKIVESKTSNSKEPKQSWGSTIFGVPSSSLNNCRRLSHLNFDYITSLAKQGLVRGLPKLKHQQDYLCSACALGKSKKHSYKPKAEDSIQEKLYLLHMDLCGPMRVQSINRRKYILVIVDDFSQFTWVKDLRSNDEVLEFVIKFLKMIQVHLNETVHKIRTDNGTEFVNQTLKAYYEEVRISHQTSVARTPQQNGVVKRWNRTLVEAAQTISRPEPKILTPRTISSGLVPSIPSSALSGSHCTKPTVLTSTHSLTTIYQDAPSTSTSQTPQETPSLVIPLGVKANNDIKVSHMDNNQSVEFPISEPSFEKSSTKVVIPNHVHSINQPPEHINKWTKDHLIDNVIGDPS
nr:retrovirus-related Pol polyprotein from transposon TNT 1-94 [Tanacetum cinerariifolium]